MQRALATIYKELLILSRDRAGLAVMFIMPLVLVVLMALIQDAPFKDYQELKIPVVLVNRDSGAVGKQVEAGLLQSKIFKVTLLDTSTAACRVQVAEGVYDMAVIIPSSSSQSLKQKVKGFVGQVMDLESDSAASEGRIDSSIVVYFAPEIKKSFKTSVMSSIRQFSSDVFAQQLFQVFNSMLSTGKSLQADSTLALMKEVIKVEEANVLEQEDPAIELNSVQHNVPAWTIFGMFFIVISLSGSIIKERVEGSYLRIRTMPGSYVDVMIGKICAYLLVCFLQAVLLLAAGIWLMPLLGLPALSIGSHPGAIAVMALTTGLAATGYGILVGTVFSTYQQASIFGAVSVVLLAALGGIWVPVYIMPGSIRLLAEFSPLYWAQDAFQQLFLYNGTVADIAMQALKLCCFFSICCIAAYGYHQSTKH